MQAICRATVSFRFRFIGYE